MNIEEIQKNSNLVKSITSMEESRGWKEFLLPNIQRRIEALEENILGGQFKGEALEDKIKERKVLLSVFGPQGSIATTKREATRKMTNLTIDEKAFNALSS